MTNSIPWIKTVLRRLVARAIVVASFYGKLLFIFALCELIRTVEKIILIYIELLHIKDITDSAVFIFLKNSRKIIFIFLSSNFILNCI